MVGDTVGSLVGMTVGAKEMLGVAEGFKVGEMLGLAEGFKVGEIVGTGLGNSVGCTVGPK
jgi:hypothetical protein